MKRTLAILIVLFTIATASHAQTLKYFATGAWWNTKAPQPPLKDAGQLDLFFYEDGTLRVKMWFNGSVINEAVGTWTETDFFGDKIRVNFSYTNPSTHTWSGVFKSSFFDDDNFFGTGNFKSLPTGAYAGKWQAAIRQ